MLVVHQPVLVSAAQHDQLVWSSDKSSLGGRHNECVVRVVSKSKAKSDEPDHKVCETSSSLWHLMNGLLYVGGYNAKLLLDDVSCGRM